MPKLLALFSLCAVFWTAAAQNIVRVRYGYFPEARPIHAACARGWLDLDLGNTKYQVTCYPQTSGGFALSRLDNKQLDVANLGSTPMAQGIARSIPLSVVYVSHYMGDSQGIYVRGDGPIQDPFDLRNKTIGVPYGSTVHYHVLFLLDLFGMTGQVNVLDLSPTAITEAWNNGEIDAAGCWGEARDYVLRNGGQGNPDFPPARQLLAAGVVADWGRPTFVVLAAHHDFAADHQIFLTHMLAVLSRINDSFLDALGEQDALNVVRWSAQASPGESLVPSMTDALMKAGESPAAPSQEFQNLQRRALDLFVQQTAEEQLSCDYLGGTVCNENAPVFQALHQTAEFLQNQKIVSTILPFTCDDECAEKIIDTTWLQNANRDCSNCYRAGPYAGESAGSTTLLSQLERLDRSSGKSPFALNEIGRAGLGEVSRGDSTCSGHTKFDLSSTETQLIGDGANALAGRSYSDNTTCTWEIRASDCPSATSPALCLRKVVLDWQRVRLWSGDFVRVYTDLKYECKPWTQNKILVGQITGFDDLNTLPRMSSFGCLFVEFISDTNQERSYGNAENWGDGFLFEASTTTDDTVCDFPQKCECFDETYSWGSDCSFVDHCLGTSILDVNNAEWTSFSSSNNIKNFADVMTESDTRYPNDLDCFFHIHYEGRTRDRGFVELEVKYDLEDTHDLLYIQTGSPMFGTESTYVVLTGTSKDTETYYVPVDEFETISVRLQTDSRGRRTGFYARARGMSSELEVEPCRNGFSGSDCEIPFCSAKTLVHDSGSRSLGRVVSQSGGQVRAQPWAPNGGCSWDFDLVAQDVWKDATDLIRLRFQSELDLEPYPTSSIGDKLVIKSGEDTESVLYIEECDSNEVCSAPWQTGVCSESEPRGCLVRTTVDVPIDRSSGTAKAVLITDRNDNGFIHSGFDFEAALVRQRPKKGKDCIDVKGAECVDGFCVCKGSVPCDCFCGAKKGKVNLGLVFGIVLPVFFILVAYFWYYRRKKIRQSREQKAIIQEKEEQLEAFRKSVVGMRKAITDYVPKVDAQKGPERAPEKKTTKKKAKKKKGTKAHSEKPKAKAIWCWKETDFRMRDHRTEEIFGDSGDCWIKYSSDANDKLEAAFLEQGQQGTASPLPGYVVDFSTLLQTKVATGFQREVKREIEDDGHRDGHRHAPPVKNVEPVKIDLSETQIGETLPSEISEEPQMVLVTGDIVQISTQRNDGWAFGTKLLHSNDALARDLVRFVTAGQNDNESVFTDTGWFQMSATDIPSGDDLAQLQDNVGDTDALAAPEFWSDVQDPTIVELFKLGPKDDERKDVVNAFMSTLEARLTGKHFKVVEVNRIQNLAMWQSYVVKRQTICYRETGQKQGEEGVDAATIQARARERFERRWLWHGTNVEVMEKIMQQGFNRSFCGKNATMYGKGVYFARDASYSAYPSYAIPDKNGFQYIMACRVVVGEYCRGTQNALTPDIRDVATQSLYDSTVGVLSGDNIANPSIYVTYHDAQAYPEYLIKFKQS